MITDATAVVPCWERDTKAGYELNRDNRKYVKSC